MKLVRLIEFLRQRLKLLVKLGYVLLGLLVVADALPFIVHKEHAHTAVERFPGFWSIFGFVACVLIIVVSKWFGHAGIMKRENFYDE
jgi:hypothetical protein